MKNKLFIIVLTACAAFTAQAQPPQPDLTDAQREKYIAEIRQYKHEYLAKELELTREQQREFFPVYDEMEDKMMKLNGETRELERRTLDKADATDTELEAAAQAVFSQRLKEGQIDMDYFEKFSKILNNRQILRLKNTERKFTQRLMKQHRRAKKDKARREASPQRQK